VGVGFSVLPTATVLSTSGRPSSRIRIRRADRFTHTEADTGSSRTSAEDTQPIASFGRIGSRTSSQSPCRPTTSSTRGDPSGVRRESRAVTGESAAEPACTSSVSVRLTARPSTPGSETVAGAAEELIVLPGGPDDFGVALVGAPQPTSSNPTASAVAASAALPTPAAPRTRRLVPVTR
jgi:hypothetical protein